MHQIHNNDNDYAWQIKGGEGTKRVRANTGRRRLNILGAYNPVFFTPTTFVTETNCDQETMQSFFGVIRETYPTQTNIIVYLDNARYQRAYEVQRKAQEYNIELKYLPPYAPNLNLIERLWRWSKKHLFKNTYYPSFEEFYDTIITFFQHPEQFRDELEKLMTLNFEIIKAI